MRFLLLILAAGLTLSAPADAQRRLSAQRGGEQDAAYRATQQGEILSLPEIRSRVRIPGADFIGAEFDGRVYRLKYMRGGEVIWIDVDARTGRVIGRQ
ncbi:PepSY domain-containing protein [Sphingosinicella sp. LHD-64]|uniref:PepSY domain-containing protein n=1 Tax=Sphingosinicella sp. LHD-64 TaxID=3072139 RepID=UPI00280C4784|nr:PepSY domain-containing protein [Sphingosinicella sp. LHD-64]MDQ8756728.1 PepSY domain-containing protein [Sphingosinicella sp. LHD-64]